MLIRIHITVNGLKQQTVIHSMEVALAAKTKICTILEVLSSEPKIKKQNTRMMLNSYTLLGSFILFMQKRRLSGTAEP